MDWHDVLADSEVQAVSYDPDIYTELICNQLGIHQDEGMIKMPIRTKDADCVILITESMKAGLWWKTENWHSPQNPFWRKTEETENKAAHRAALRFNYGIYTLRRR